MLRLPVLFCALLISGCALSKPNVGTTPLEPQAVDGRYRFGSLDHADGPFSSSRVWNFFKTFESDGRIGVCGAYVADVTPERGERLQGAYRRDGSYVDFNGYDYSRPGLRINPGFMQFTRRAGDSPLELSKDLQAGCIRIERAWDSSFADPRVGIYIRPSP